MEPNGRGDGPSASSLKDEVGNRSTPSDFSLGQLKHGNEATDLYHVLVAGVEGTPMLPATLVMTREMGEQVDAKRYLPSSDLNAAKSFASSLMPSDEFFDLHEAKQNRLMEGWRWDLVDYLQSLAKPSGLLRSILGLDPLPTLYGAAACEVGERHTSAK